MVLATANALWTLHLLAAQTALARAAIVRALYPYAIDPKNLSARRNHPYIQVLLFVSVFVHSGYAMAAPL
jgi:hypothetical protein